ncbi:LytR/AlgR family response regulator transcription factor [Sporocytophaga myxococcoides]|uniref:LytR/AlgR family response regulator transcription factor n=1 Tax=Sporocytophaga myxococcoides TaxID=153721 RepID=UPI0004029804|nr:LytTR family DNA-binding domain-containing protein [Sporocytophaga myxococcoides]
MVLKAVIVDDEVSGRETLSHYIQKYCQDVEIVGFADSVKSGLEVIEKCRPDILFLDVEMPYGNAFDLLEQVNEITFETVFVTAFSNYAMKALNCSAAYYILKPIDIDELVSAVNKIKAQREKSKEFIHTKILIENINIANKQLQKIVLPTMEGFEVVQVKDIIRCQANDNFTDIILAEGKKMLICRTLKHFEGLLEDYDFMRVHKSHLINIQFIKRYRKGKGGQVIMSDGSEIDVSPAKKQDLLDRFG